MSRPTRYHLWIVFVYEAITRYGQTFQTVPLTRHRLHGLIRVRSPLLTESRLISFPPGNEMFQFPGFRLTTLWIQVVMTTKVVGFPHSDTPGSKLVCQLPEAFRRLPRPSSPPAAKASTTCA